MLSASVDGRFCGFVMCPQHSVMKYSMMVVMVSGLRTICNVNC